MINPIERNGEAMKNFSFGLLISLVIVVACIGIGSVSGCGGGLIPAPPVHNLSGIQGQWNGTLTYEGDAETGSMDAAVLFIITPDTVIDGYGVPWLWEYDGMLLILSLTSTTIDDVPGGNIRLTESTTLEMLIPIGAVEAEVTGEYIGTLVMVEVIDSVEVETVVESTYQVITGLIEKDS